VSHWQDTMVDRPETDGAAYATGWTVSGLAVLAVIFAAWVFAIWDNAGSRLRLAVSSAGDSRLEPTPPSVGGRQRPRLAPTPGPFP